ncbi:MAG: hypothetical protein JEZ06_20530 [Anaerolineaceae bacterium]|nr:hypothetical protein [Anaerolineaceae bacterium]
MLDKSQNRTVWFCFIIILIIFSIPGCGLSPSRSAPGAVETPYFVPPTYEPTPNPTQEPTSIQATATPTQKDCQNNLSFISDITIPDGTAIHKGSSLDKQWEVQNSGTCNWDSSYKFTLLSGDALGSDETQALPPSRSGSKTIIQVQFTAPQETGNFHSVWQAKDGNGNLFGEPFYMDIMVID